jgi:hypothetical protein
MYEQQGLALCSTSSHTNEIIAIWNTCPEITSNTKFTESGDMALQEMVFRKRDNISSNFSANLLFNGQRNDITKDSYSCI